jgi:hypothetical protein
LQKKRFILNYLVWSDHNEVEPPVVGAESDKNEDEDQMDEMIMTLVGNTM